MQDDDIAAGAKVARDGIASVQRFGICQDFRIHTRTVTVVLRTPYFIISRVRYCSMYEVRRQYWTFPKQSFIVRLHVLYVDHINAVLPPDVSSITDRNHLDSLAPRQHIPAAVAAAERDMLGIRLKAVPS